MKNIWTIAKREFNNYFSSPVAYTVAFLILAIIGLVFVINLLAFSSNPFGMSEAPDARMVTGPMAFMLMLAIPALTMRLLADEIRMGTMELLMTAPLRDYELVVGKWLGAFLFVLVVIGISLVFPLMLNTMVTPGIDQLQMMAGYLGIILAAAALLGLGTGISAIFGNQIAAFFSTLVLFVVLWWLIGAPANILPVGGEVFSYLDMSAQLYNNFNEGIIKLSSVVYFLSLTSLGLLLAPRLLKFEVALMKNDPRRFAPLGLALSALAIVAFIILLLVRGLASAGLFQPPDPLLLERASWISLSIMVLGLALTAFIDPERTRKFLTGRQVQYGSNSVIMLLAFIGILFFINLLAFQNPKSWDVTEGQVNTLAPETITLLGSLPEPISARAYYSTRMNSTQTRKLFEDFKQNANGNFTYEFIDPDSNPVAAQNDNVDRDGTTILRMGARTELVNLVDEEGLAVSIVKLINPESRVVYFLTGHGEANTEQGDDASYSLVKRALENKNYTVKSLNLGSEGTVPTDAKSVVIAGPQTPLPAEEVKLLQDYLDKGGALVVMEEPAALTNYQGAPDPLAGMLKSWGITLQNDVLFDPRANPPLLVYADALNYAQHPITDRLRGINSRFFTSQSLLLGEAPQNISLTALANTYNDAWGETDLASIENNQVAFDEGKDLPGPLVLAAAGENFDTKARLVVFGDFELGTDALYKNGYGDILLNAIDWTTGQEKLISISPKNNQARTYNAPSNLGLIGMILVSICLIPLALVAGGISAWYSRRKRG